MMDPCGEEFDRLFMAQIWAAAGRSIAWWPGKKPFNGLPRLGSRYRPFADECTAAAWENTPDGKAATSTDLQGQPHVSGDRTPRDGRD